MHAYAAHADRCIQIPDFWMQVAVKVGQQTFEDDIVWDVGAPQASVAVFASRTCQDLGLAADFLKPMIKGIREQLTIAQALGRKTPEVHIKQEQPKHEAETKEKPNEVADADLADAG